MKEHLQEFLVLECKMCGLTKDRWGHEWVEKRRFVTQADDVKTGVCTNCGFTKTLTDEEIKDAQLNSESGRK